MPVSSIVKQFVPPVFFSVLKKLRSAQSANAPIGISEFRGNYANWKQAEDDASGYDNDSILEKVKNSLLKIKNGDAVYERDSVLFDQVHYSWPVLACLQKIALQHDGHLSVADFGGSLGSSYYQNRNFLAGIKKLEWHIVEQEKFVKCGLENFAGNELSFHYSTNELVAKHHINCLFLSGVLPYLPAPYEWLQEFLSYNFEYILVDRNAFISDTKERLTVQQVPESIYKASYPCWFFTEARFLNVFREKYELVAGFDSFADIPDRLEDGKQVFWKGFFFRKK